MSFAGWVVVVYCFFCFGFIGVDGLLLGVACCLQIWVMFSGFLADWFLFCLLYLVLF